MAKKKYYQRADGLFETIRKINGKRVAFRGKTCAEVDRKMLEYREEVGKGRKVPEIVDAWLEEVEPGLRENTKIIYRRAGKRIKEAFPGRAGTIQPLDIRRYMEDFKRNGYAKGTARIELVVLRQVFSYAVLQGDIAVSPVAEVKLGKGMTAKVRRPLTEEEEQKVKAYRGPHWLFGYFLLFTGCRRGELLALEWQDIDRKAGVIYVNKKIDYPYGQAVLDNKLKNRASRTVPLLDMLANVLPKDRVGKIFPGKDGDYLTRYGFDLMWEEFRTGAGLADDVTPHCFRHSFATICYEAGVDTKSTAAFLGDTEQVTEHIYAALRERHHFSSAEKVNAYLELREVELSKKQA